MYGPRPIRFPAHLCADYSKYRGFLAGVFLSASPLDTAPPSNLPRLYYNGSAAKSHSTTTQYRQLRRLDLREYLFANI